MVDIHSHILPAIDDGCKSLEESLELIAREVGAGTAAFVATPHVYTVTDMDASPQLPERVEELCAEVAKAGIEVQIVQGAEVYPIMEVMEALDKGRPLTFGNMGKYMLVDLPMTVLPHDFATFLFELQARKITPIIAHPERCGAFQQDPDSLREYVDRGIPLQVNGGSVRGRYGPIAEDVADYILGRRWAHFLASDAHGPRPIPLLAKAVGLAREVVEDESYIELITCTSGRCVVEGTPLPALPKPPPMEGGEKRRAPKPPGFFGRLFGRG
jgi:protein-tyrosine phosphatase